MFGLVTQRKYNVLDKKYTSVQKELDDIRKYCVCLRKQDLETLLTDIKKLENNNEVLYRQVRKYEEVINKIFNLTNECKSVNNENCKGIDTTAYWIKTDGKPDICSNCGYSVYNVLDSEILYCSGCGRRMIPKTENREDE